MQTDSASTVVLEPPPPGVASSTTGLAEPVLQPLAAVELKGPPPWLDRGHIPGLDGLRGIAVLLVVLVHCVQTPGFPQWTALKGLAVHGAVGVEIFFVISGFLITTLLLREFERFGKVDLKRFYLRRSLRIIPAYLGLLAVVAIGQWLGKFKLESRDWIGAMTYTTNFLYHPKWALGHTWSLSIEEHFYLLWPFVLFAWGPVGGRRTAVGCVVGCWLARCFVALILPSLIPHDEAAYCAAMSETWTFTRLDTISMGCLLAVWIRDDFARAWLDRLSRGEALGIALCLLCLSIGLAPSAKYNLCIGYSLNGACITILIWGLVRASGRWSWLLDSRILVIIGLGSYSIYLWQQVFINPQMSGWMHAFPQNVLLALGAAWLSFWLIEKPSASFKERFAA